MRRLYIGPRRDVALMEFVCGFRPGRDYVYHVKPDGHLVHRGTPPVIHRLILRVLLYCPSPAAGRLDNRELRYFCLYGEVGGLVFGLSCLFIRTELSVTCRIV